MFQLGECYRLDNLTNIDSTIAFYYYKIAADQGHTKARLCAGLSYANGIGVEKDDNRASFYLSHASIDSNPFATHWAGELDLKAGRTSSTKSHFKVAAKQEYAWAQNQL